MTGLRVLDLYIEFLWPFPACPTCTDPWVIPLFDLQRKLKAIRNFEMTIKQDSSTRVGASYLAATELVEVRLKNRLAELKQSAVVSHERFEV